MPARDPLLYTEVLTNLLLISLLSNFNPLGNILSDSDLFRWVVDCSSPRGIHFAISQIARTIYDLIFDTRFSK